MQAKTSSNRLISLLIIYLNKNSPPHSTTPVIQKCKRLSIFLNLQHLATFYHKKNGSFLKIYNILCQSSVKMSLV